jgi:hypothetical protein
MKDEATAGFSAGCGCLAAIFAVAIFASFYLGLLALLIRFTKWVWSW